MASPAGFIRKPAMLFDGRHFEIIGIDEALGIAKHEMTLLPPFPSDSVIHDTA